MLVPHTSETTAKCTPIHDNQRSISTLMRAIALSQGYCSLILVNCNSLVLRQQTLDRLQATSALKPRELWLPKSATTFYTAILPELGGAPPPALIVLGWESVTELDRLLASTNLVCSEFNSRFSFPLVFWVTDEILRKMIRKAPDLYNRMPTAIRFV
ncbi:MAG: hypothetical protein ACRC62_07635 [Microcoleus sp.]